MTLREQLNAAFDLSERVGAIGSPSTTHELTVDVFGAAASNKLVGELVAFRYLQGGRDHYALGQITEVTLRNAMLEQPIPRGIIRQRERFDAVQGRHDTHVATVNLGAVFACEGYTVRPSSLATVPPTGTTVHSVTDAFLNGLLAPYRNEVFYLGTVYGSSLRLPMWFKHFGSGQGGAGESYCIGIFGKTGSGKSSLAKMILVAYARHPQMRLFILDPQGEFARDARIQGPPPSAGNLFNCQVFATLGRRVTVYSINNFTLDRWELWRQILVRLGFFQVLGIRSSEYQENTAEYLEDYLRNQLRSTLQGLSDMSVYRQSLQHIVQMAQQGRIYGTTGRGSPVERVIQLTTQALEDPQSSVGRLARDRWQQTANLFARRKGTMTVDEIIRQALNSFEVTVVDLSVRPQGIEDAVWDEEIKPRLVDRFLDAVIRYGENEYAQGRSLNTLVVLDEAHRFAPRERPENEIRARIKARLIDGVRTTRKYGLGWMFISQTISSLDREIWGQMRIGFFGFGLGTGLEFQTLRELVGTEKDYLKLYQSFRDPHSTFGDEHRTFSFMSTGPVSPLSFSGAPLFFDAFTDARKFLVSNRIGVGSDSEG